MKKDELIRAIRSVGAPREPLPGTGTLRRQLVTSDEAVPCEGQPTKPCSDCPWARAALAGWLGEMTPEEWLQVAHSDAKIDCHTLVGPQCAGAAIYRANVSKHPRDPEVLRLPSDRARVFSSPVEFLKHHKGTP